MIIIAMMGAPSPEFAHRQVAAAVLRRLGADRHLTPILMVMLRQRSEESSLSTIGPFFRPGRLYSNDEAYARCRLEK